MKGHSTTFYEFCKPLKSFAWNKSLLHAKTYITVTHIELLPVKIMLKFIWKREKNHLNK